MGELMNRDGITGFYNLQATPLRVLIIPRVRSIMLHMATAEVIELRTSVGPRSESNRQVLGSVSALLGSRRPNLSVKMLADAIGMKSSTLYTRLQMKTEFGASEVSAIAHYFGVTIEDLYNGLGGRIPPAPLPSTIVVPTVTRQYLPSHTAPVVSIWTAPSKRSSPAAFIPSQQTG